MCHSYMDQAHVIDAVCFTPMSHAVPKRLEGDTSMPSRPLCQCACGCRRRPGRRIICALCGRAIGPGCCWVRTFCHMCGPPPVMAGPGGSFNAYGNEGPTSLNELHQEDSEATVIATTSCSDIEDQQADAYTESLTKEEHQWFQHGFQAGQAYLRRKETTERITVIKKTQKVTTSVMSFNSNAKPKH